MSSNYITYRFYFKDGDSHEKVQQIISGGEGEKAIDTLGFASALSKKEDIEHFSVTPKYMLLDILASTSVDINHHLIKAGKYLASEFVKVDIFYDQVGEEERYYFFRGKPVNSARLSTLISHYEPGAELQALIEDSNLSAFTKAMNKGEDPDTRVDDLPLLFIAYDEREHAIFKRLLTSGANPNIANSSGVTILERIITEHDRDKIPYLHALMHEGVDLNTVFRDGSSSLWHAWAFGPHTAALFINKAVAYTKPKDVYQDEEGDDDEVLCTAIKHNDGDVVATKLATLSNENDGFLYFATVCCEVDQLPYLKKLIEKGLKPFGEASDNDQLLNSAATAQALDILRFLLNKAIDQKFNLNGVGPSLLEALARNPMAHDVIQLLCETGIKPASSYLLYQAICHQATENVSLFLRFGCPIEDEDCGLNFLHDLLYELNGEIAQLLIDAGVDPLLKNEEGENVIQRAMQAPDIEKSVQSVFLTYAKNLQTDECIWVCIITDQLDLFSTCWHELDDKALKNAQAQTFLMAAARHNAESITTFLLQQGVDVQAQDAVGNTAIAEATMAGNVAICRQLLKAGSRVNETVCTVESDEDDKDNSATLLEMMGMQEISALVGVMGNTGEPVSIAGNQCSCLMWAAAEGNLALVNVLLEFDADISFEDGEGNGVLYYAVTNNHKSVFEVLFEHGAKLNIESNSQGNLLMVATFRQLPEMCQLLADKGLDLNAGSGGNGDTALIVAACTGALQEQDMTSQLLSLGANMNVRNAQDKSALICACEHLNFEATAVLLEHKAHTNFVDTDGQTAYDYFLAADVDTTDYNIEINDLKPDNLMKFVKMAKRVKRFFLRSVLPGFGLALMIGFFSDTYSRYLVYIILAWWGYLLVNAIHKKYRKPKAKTEAALGLGVAAIVKAMEKGEQQKKAAQKIIDSWDDDSDGVMKK